MKLTGHKTESVHQRYAIVAENNLREAGAKLTAASTEPSSGEASRKTGAVGRAGAEAVTQ